MSSAPHDGLSTRSDRKTSRTALFDDSLPPSLHDALANDDQVIARDYRDGIERRIDGPHPFGAPSDEGIALDESTPADPVARNEPPVEAAAPVDDMLAQAAQIAQHLRSQLNEIDRRESSLNEQLTALDQERRSIRTWVAQFEDDMVRRAARIRTNETELASKIAAAEELVQELRGMERGAQAMREEMTAEKARLRELVEQEFAAQRAEIQQARQANDEMRRVMADQTEQNQREHDATILECRRRLEDEWSRLRNDAAESLEKERSQLALDRATWAAQRDSEQSRLQRERETHESNVQRIESEFDSRRRAFESEMQARTQEHEQRTAAELQKLQDERERTRLQQQQERTVFENRLRFQKEHLEKSREELETARNEFRKEQQQARAQAERIDSLLRKRRLQLDRYRALLEEREQSAEREHDLLSRARRNFESESESDRNRFRTERETWSQERQGQRSELRRQRDQLAVHSEQLEARQARIEHLRQSLDETHRNTLELRLAVEDAWARFWEAAGVDVARERVEEARAACTLHYRRLHEQILAHRAELTELHRVLQKQREEFNLERQTLASCMSSRDDALQLWEGQLRQTADSLDARESAWRAARDRWNHEKLGAEEIIRDLLRQLTHLNDLERSASHDRESVSLPPLHPEVKSAPAA